jgi:hypothetical protein
LRLVIAPATLAGNWVQVSVGPFFSHTRSLEPVMKIAILAVIRTISFWEGSWANVTVSSLVVLPPTAWVSLYVALKVDFVVFEMFFSICDHGELAAIATPGVAATREPPRRAKEASAPSRPLLEREEVERDRVLIIVPFLRTRPAARPGNQLTSASRLATGRACQQYITHPEADAPRLDTNANGKPVTV